MDRCTENVIEWIRGEKVAGVTLTSGRLSNRIKKLAETREDVEIIAENKDGSIFAHIPVSWVRINPPKVLNLSEEERERRRKQGNIMSKM